MSSGGTNETENLGFKMNLKSNVGLTIEDFILYARLGLTDEASTIIREVLWQHILFYPVFAEVTTFLLLEDRILDLCSILTLFRQEAILSKYNRLQQEYIQCFDPLLHLEGAIDANTRLKDLALTKKQAICQSLTRIAQAISPIQVQSMVIHLYISSSIDTIEVSNLRAAHAIQDLCSSSYLWEATMAFKVLCTKVAATSKHHVRETLPSIHKLYSCITGHTSMHGADDVSYQDLELFVYPLLCLLSADMALLPILAAVNQYDLSSQGTEFSSLVETAQRRFLMLVQLVPNTAPRGNYWEILQRHSNLPKPASFISETTTLAQTEYAELSASTSVIDSTAHSTPRAGSIFHPEQCEPAPLEEPPPYIEQSVNIRTTDSLRKLETDFLPTISRTPFEKRETADFLAEKVSIETQEPSPIEIVVIGSLLEEEVVFTNPRPELGSFLTMMAKQKAFGGGGGLTSISLSRALRDGFDDLGMSNFSIQLIAAVADEYSRDRFRKWLKASGISTESVETWNSTKRSGQLTDLDNPRKDFLTLDMDVGSSKIWQDVSLRSPISWSSERFRDIEQICGLSFANLVVVTMELRPQVVEQIIQTCHAANVNVMLIANPGQQLSIDCFAGLEHVICTREDACRMLACEPGEMDSERLGVACRQFLLRGVKNIVIITEMDEVYFGTGSSINVMSTWRERTMDSSIRSHHRVAAFTGPYAAESAKKKSKWRIDIAVERGLKALIMYDHMRDEIDRFAWASEINEAEPDVEMNSEYDFVHRAKHEEQVRKQITEREAFEKVDAYHSHYNSRTIKRYPRQNPWKQPLRAYFKRRSASYEVNQSLTTP